MATEKIQLRKIRDFSTAISDTIAFIRQEAKPLLKTVLLFSGIFILASAIIYSLTQRNSVSILSSILRNGSGSIEEDYTAIGTTYANLGWVFLAGFFSQTAILTTVAGYLKVYESHPGVSPTPEEVWQQFSHYFFRIFFLLLAITILVIIGSLFCLLPGIYLAVVLAPAGMVIVMEDTRSLSGVFNRCFTLIRENFWPSLGLYLIAYLLYLVCASGSSLIVSGVGGFLSYLTTRDMSAAFTVAYGILNVLSHLLIVFVYLVVAFNYFSLVEKWDGTGLQQRIEQMGAKEPGVDKADNTGEDLY